MAEIQPQRHCSTLSPHPSYHLVSGRKRSRQMEREGKLIISTSHCTNRKNQKVLQNDSVPCIHQERPGGSTLHLDVGLCWRASSPPLPACPTASGWSPGRGSPCGHRSNWTGRCIHSGTGQSATPPPQRQALRLFPALWTLILDQETGAFQSGVD